MWEEPLVTFILIAGLAVARATRLWRDDKITEGLRNWLEERLVVYRGHEDRTNPYDPQWVERDDRFSIREHVKSWLEELLWCPWCLSGWLAMVPVIYLDTATSRSVPLPVMVWLASWWVACAAYWLVELISDSDSVVYHERERRGVDG